MPTANEDQPGVSKGHGPSLMPVGSENNLRLGRPVRRNQESPRTQLRDDDFGASVGRTSCQLQHLVGTGGSSHESAGSFNPFDMDCRLGPYAAAPTIQK